MSLKETHMCADHFRPKSLLMRLLKTPQFRIFIINSLHDRVFLCFSFVFGDVAVNTRQNREIHHAQSQIMNLRYILTRLSTSSN